MCAPLLTGWGRVGDSPVWLARQTAARASRVSMRALMVSLRWLWSAQTPVFPPASSTIYTLGPALKARVGRPITGRRVAGDSARAIWGHPPQIYRPNPKGCCGWNQGSLGRPLEWRRRVGGNLRLPASGCPLPLPKGATEVP